MSELSDLLDDALTEPCFCGTWEGDCPFCAKTTKVRQGIEQLESELEAERGKVRELREALESVKGGMEGEDPPNDLDIYIELAEQALNNTTAPTEAEIRGTCEWTEDDDGSWDTECGRKWDFMNDGPVENGMDFCMGCGKQVYVDSVLRGES